MEGVYVHRCEAACTRQEEEDKGNIGHVTLSGTENVTPKLRQSFDDVVVGL